MNKLLGFIVRKGLFLVVISLMILGASLSYAQSDSEFLDGMYMHKHTYKGPVTDDDITYTLYLPPDYSEEKGPYPLVIFLHGAGGGNASENVCLSYEESRRIDLIGDCIFVFPESYGGTRWTDGYKEGVTPEMNILQELMPYLESEYAITTNRDARTVMGFSMGSFGSYYWGAKYMDQFSVIIGLDANGTISMADTNNEGYVSAYLENLELLQNGYLAIRVVQAGLNTALFQSELTEYNIPYDFIQLSKDIEDYEIDSFCVKQSDPTKLSLHNPSCLTEDLWGRANWTFIEQNIIRDSSPTPQAPTANAGPNQTVTDTDVNGTESVTLDGSGSSDPDGTIVSYEWSEGGSQIATGVNPSVALAVGSHTITLTVTDNDGVPASDTVTITVEEGDAGSVIEPGIYHVENKYHDPARLKNDGTALPKIVAVSDGSAGTVWMITETAPSSGTYYIDNGDMRLSDGDGGNDPVLVSASTTNDRVKWTFVESATANEYWITTIAGNNQPRIRTDGTSVPDMQKTGSSGSWTRWELIPATVTPPPTVQFVSSSSSVDEPAGSVSITVALSKTSGSDVVVDCNISAGTATASEDYILASGVVTVPDGQLTASIDLTIVDDFIMEDDETVTVSLVNVSGATLGSTIDHTVTIADDDGNFEAGTVLVFSNWTQVALANEYVYAPVIVCVVNYDSNTVPVVARLRNVTTDSFEIMLQNPGDAEEIVADEVHFIAMEEGAWTLADGTKIEAQLVSSEGTSGKSDWGTDQMEQLTYLHAYSNAPAVLGQVMSYNDPLWSAFWTCGASRTGPATATTCYVGKQVGEDDINTRTNETLGVIVVEADANGSLGNGVAFQSGVGADSVRGVGDAPAYSYALQAGVFSAAPAVGVITMQAMDGNNGGWGYLYGANPLSSDAVNLAVDEDQVVDSERKHTDEQMSYMIIESKSVSRMTLAE